jgi:hypothetical protein
MLCVIYVECRFAESRGATGSDKRTSLQCWIINYNCKEFNGTGPQKEKDIALADLQILVQT